MYADWISIVAFIAALGCGVIGGVFFAFSTFIMRALARVPAAQGIAAMQSINVAVINPWFLAPFLGTSALGAVLAITTLTNWSRPGGVFLLTGSLLYLVGTFGVTMAFNVPRNNALAAVDPASVAGAEVWRQYLASWTAWNHVRTAAALLGAVALIYGIAP